MSSVVISGDVSGSVTLQAPSAAGTTVLTLPATSGTVVTTAGGTSGSFTTLTSTQDATLATSSGNVGIGTTSPIAKLDVRGAGAYFYDNSTTDFQLTVASSVSTIGTTTATPLAFKSNSTERLRIGTSGELGLSGANYGTSGQVLTSNGSGAAASWTTVSSSPTTAQVQSAMAGSSVGALGTFGIFWYTSTANPGTTASGISYSNCVADTNGGPSGTWRCMSYSFGGGGGKNVTSWLRIA